MTNKLFFILMAFYFIYKDTLKSCLGNNESNVDNLFFTSILVKMCWAYTK